MKVGDLVLPNWYSSDYFKAAGAAIGLIVEERKVKGHSYDVMYLVLLGEVTHLFHSDEFKVIE